MNTENMCVSFNGTLFKNFESNPTSFTGVTIEQHSVISENNVFLNRKNHLNIRPEIRISF